MIKQEFVFKGDYGLRDNYLPLFKEMLSKYDKNSLTGMAFFINNIPYKLELYIAFTFENSVDEVRGLREIFLQNGLVHTPNITIHNLLNAYYLRRFDMFTCCNFDDLVLSYSLFYFPTISELRAKGYDWSQNLDGNNQIFISYSHKQRKEISDLVSLINHLGPSVWVDYCQIDLGDEIITTIHKGINESSLSIVWLSNDFINSKFPLHELTTLIHESIMNGKRPIFILEYDVDPQELISKGYPIQNYHYHKRSKNETIPFTFNIIKDTLIKHLDI
ncbi:toll/interleukin-1 receptor domain-containing protein [Lysinibacillus sphaericus]|uniref:toll/interleukin-1 receptor domain-containing protein n=1 Tax=Lysinibacillus sphaericus TaxID=1421 RepID=UPI00381D32D2